MFFPTAAVGAYVGAKFIVVAPVVSVPEKFAVTFCVTVTSSGGSLSQLTINRVKNAKRVKNPNSLVFVFI